MRTKQSDGNIWKRREKENDARLSGESKGRRGDRAQKEGER